MATKADRPKVLIEQWLPIAEIGAECMRERGASSALPPLYFLHVWWARRPLTVSRAAILASLLSAYPTGDEHDVRPWPTKFSKRFPSFHQDKAWFLQLIGIRGDPVAAQRLIQYERSTGKVTPGNKYGYARAFTTSPSSEQLETLYDLLEWVWGTREITFCDPMAGGGSIPFEAIRYGLTAHVNELNPVASVILKATLDYPARCGPVLATDIRKYGTIWAQRIRQRLSQFFPPHLPTPDGSLKGGTHFWARTINCPTTGKCVPLSPNWWLRKGSDPVALRLIARVDANECHFEIVTGTSSCTRANPDQGTVKHGTGMSPWTGESIPGDYIKAEAQAGRMGHQLYAVEVFTGKQEFRLPTSEDLERFSLAVGEIRHRLCSWEAADFVPTEPIGETSNYERGHRLYGIRNWQEFFSPRQLTVFAIAVEELNRIIKLLAQEEPDPQRAAAIATYLGLAIDKAMDYNCLQTFWHSSRGVLGHKFNKHNYTFQWSYVEFDAARNLFPWAIEQVASAFKGIAELSQPTAGMGLLTDGVTSPVTRLHLTRGDAQSLQQVSTKSINHICVDPPYYDNVHYAECSDFFYVWLKRSLGSVHPTLLGGLDLAPKDEEVVANPARFAHSRKKKELAEQDYENKMRAAFREMYRILDDNGILTIMFTHKRVEAWDTLGSSLINAGFRIDASWPVHTESEFSTHQVKKSAAASTILLACRKRLDANQTTWWEDLKARVRQTAREKAAEFEAQGIKGVDLYISTFGPVLSIISEHWPVLTSETDPKTGDPLPLKPGEALDLARQEVVNLRKQGLLLGRSVEFDPVTDWYLMAWDAFKAQAFPADEARKLALALGLDLEQNLVKDKRLVTKKSASVVLSLPAARRKKGMVDEDADTFPHLIDALHTAMMIYDEEGSKACQVFVDRQGLRTDSRTKALVQAMMEAIPTTRDKDGKFLRPEMTTLDGLRVLFWDDLPAPKEEEPPQLDRQKMLAGFEEAEVVEEKEAEDEDE